MDTQSKMQWFQQVFGGAWMTQALAVAAELGIAEILARGPRTPEELATETRVNSDALRRLLRALASAGVFAADEQGRYSLTPLAEMLRSDVPRSQRAMAIMMGAEFHETWGQLLHTMRTGEPGFNKRYGMQFFEFMTKNPDRHAIYDAAMTAVHDRETQPMLDAYDFAPFRILVDVGGGNGRTLAAILKRHPKLNGVLFDLPAVADRARATVTETGVLGRCRIAGGDFFTSVPSGADAYLLRHIIHDWEDRDAITILRRCREAMNPDGKLLVVETVIPPGNEPSFGKWLDLMMLLVAGRERAQEEYARLFSAAGLKLNRVVPTTAGVSVIEGAR